MTVPQRIERLSSQLVRRRDLARSGVTGRKVAALVANGELVRVRKGWYLPGQEWSNSRPEDRHLAALIAAREEGGPDRVFSHRSAATLLDLPVWSRWAAGQHDTDPAPRTVHTMAGLGSSSTSVEHLVRHRSSLASERAVSVNGFTCTSPSRTIFDLARTHPFPITLACADAWLARDRRMYETTGTGQDGRSAWQTQMLARAEGQGYRRGRGVRAVRALAQLADPRSESVLESVSRLRLLQLGLDFEMQLPVRSEWGATLRLDFVFPRLHVFGECDGKVKYTNAAMLEGRSPERTLLEEKRRHDWVSGSTGMRGVRWGAADVVSRDRLAHRLRAFHVAFPGRASREIGVATAEFLDLLP